MTPVDAELSPADRAMLDYVAKLTRHAYRVTPEDLDGLRGHGFDDRAILQINLIASYFNFINRVAEIDGMQKSATVAERLAALKAQQAA